MSEKASGKEAGAEGTAATALDLRDDAEKRVSLVKLRDRYVEARGLGPSSESHANLEWILGARRAPTQDPLEFETKTIELVGLWLQDLAVELDAGLLKPPAPALDESDRSLHEARIAVTKNLRDATVRFLAAFPPPA